MANTPRFCRQCGYPLEEDDRACARCGAPARGHVPKPLSSKQPPALKKPAPPRETAPGSAARAPADAPLSQPFIEPEPTDGGASAAEPTPTEPRARSVSWGEAIGVIFGAALLFLTIASMGVLTLPKLGLDLRLFAPRVNSPTAVASAAPPTAAPGGIASATARPLPTLAAPTATLLPATATSLPPVTGQEELSYQGVRFSYAPGLLSGYNAQTLPETAPAANVPAWSVAPQHIQITLSGYALSGGLHTPGLYVYPAREFAALSPAASAAVETLTTLLRDRPAQVDGVLPFLPIWNAAQVFHARVEYLPFAGGSGVRYLTQYAQGQEPVSNPALFYTFQGLTADGRYYVTAVLPVNHLNLPAGPDPAVFNADAGGYPAYLAETTAWLDAQPDDAFTPSLAVLDTLVRSLEIR